MPLEVTERLGDSIPESVRAHLSEFLEESAHSINLIENAIALGNGPGALPLLAQLKDSCNNIARELRS